MIAVAEPTVIVLEDSDEDFDTAQEAALAAGLVNPLRRATTGEACLELLLVHAEGPRSPAVVLLDLNTPGMDGRDALLAIRTDPALRSLAVVVLSTSANPRDVSHCYAHGANAYHVKPVRYVEHLQILRELFTYWVKWVTLPPRLGDAR